MWQIIINKTNILLAGLFFLVIEEWLNIIQLLNLATLTRLCLVTQSVMIFSGQSVISRVYASCFGSGTAGAVPRAVPCSGNTITLMNLASSRVIFTVLILELSSSHMQMNRDEVHLMSGEKSTWQAYPATMWPLKIFFLLSRNLFCAPKIRIWLSMDWQASHLPEDRTPYSQILLHSSWSMCLR